MNATVKDMMTTKVVAVRVETTFKEMAAVLRRHRVSALPVVDDAGRVLGVVSEADLLAKEALADPGLVAELVLTFPLPREQDGTALDTYLSAVAERESSADVASLRYIFAPESVV